VREHQASWSGTDDQDLGWLFGHTLFDAL
jgi:hypothetical protein